MVNMASRLFKKELDYEHKRQRPSHQRGPEEHPGRLAEGRKPKEIAALVGKDERTVSREIMKRRTPKANEEPPSPWTGPPNARG